MKFKSSTWLLGLAITLAVILIPIILFWPRDTGAKGAPVADPAASLPAHRPHTDHKHLLSGPFETGQDVTAACLECHPNAASELMKTTHWTWESKPFDVPWRD
jgi:hypothetical protein